MITATKSKTKYSRSLPNFRVFEEAREAVTKLSVLKSLLSSQDEETLSILIDKKLMAHLDKSLKEVKKGKLEPLKNIL